MAIRALSIFLLEHFPGSRSEPGHGRGRSGQLPVPGEGDCRAGTFICFQSRSAVDVGRHSAACQAPVSALAVRGWLSLPRAAPQSRARLRSAPQSDVISPVAVMPPRAPSTGNPPGGFFFQVLALFMAPKILLLMQMKIIRSFCFWAGQEGIAACREHSTRMGRGCLASSVSFHWIHIPGQDEQSLY